MSIAGKKSPTQDAAESTTIPNQQLTYEGTNEQNFVEAFQQDEESTGVSNNTLAEPMGRKELKYSTNDQNNAKTFGDYRDATEQGGDHELFESDANCVSEHQITEDAAKHEKEITACSGDVMTEQYPVSDREDINSEECCKMCSTRLINGSAGEKRRIRNQILFDERTLCIKCIFWTGHHDDHDAKFHTEGYKKAATKSFSVDRRDSVQFHFTTPDRELYYFNDRRTERTVELEDIWLDQYAMYNLVINPDPDRIKNRFVVIYYQLSINGKVLNWNEEIRFRNLEMHPDISKRVERPFPSNFQIINQPDHSKTIADTVAKDNATVSQESHHCKSSVDGRT